MQTGGFLIEISLHKYNVELQKRSFVIYFCYPLIIKTFGRTIYCFHNTFSNFFHNLYVTTLKIICSTIFQKYPKHPINLFIKKALCIFYKKGLNLNIFDAPGILPEIQDKHFISRFQSREGECFFKNAVSLLRKVKYKTTTTNVY